MRAMLAFSPFIMYVILVVAILMEKLFLKLRSANLPTAVSNAIDAQFPETSTLAVKRNDWVGIFQIELTDHCNNYLVEVRPDGKIINVVSDALIDDPSPTDAAAPHVRGSAKPTETSI